MSSIVLTSFGAITNMEKFNLTKLCACCFLYSYVHQYQNYNQNEKHPPLKIAVTFGAKKLNSGSGKSRRISHRRLKPKEMQDSSVRTNFKSRREVNHFWHVDPTILKPFQPSPKPEDSKVQCVFWNQGFKQLTSIKFNWPIDEFTMYFPIPR